MAHDKTDKPHTMDELAEAMGHYTAAKATYDAAIRQVTAKQKEMGSFEKDAEKADHHVQRFKAQVRKILANLEKE